MHRRGVGGEIFVAVIGCALNTNRKDRIEQNPLFLLGLCVNAETVLNSLEGVSCGWKAVLKSQTF